MCGGVGQVFERLTRQYANLRVSVVDDVGQGTLVFFQNAGERLKFGTLLLDALLAACVVGARYARPLRGQQLGQSARSVADRLNTATPD